MNSTRHLQCTVEITPKITCVIPVICVIVGKHIHRKPNAADVNMTKTYSADLQKVSMIPRMESFKSVVFTHHIIALNESFVPVGTKSSCLPVAVLWHERIAGRKKEDITSAFHSFFLHRRDQKLITLWLDNCSGQNKNWALFSCLLYIISSPETITDVIRLKYFEPGHTFMSADSFHH